MNPAARTWSCPPAPADAARFHTGLPGAGPTPLTEHTSLAAELGVRRVFVKDESSRFGLPAFKALGVSYAIHRVIGEMTRVPVAPGWEGLRGAAASLARPVELVAATDGNHGHAVAHFARLLGLTARILVPAVTEARVVSAIAAEGARVTVTDGGYDEAVREAARLAAALPSAVLIQDTAWPGYEKIPRWIVDGYSTLFQEVDAQLRDTGEGRPDLVVVPMGVGSLAQAAVTHCRGGAVPGPALLGVEPDSAGCVRLSLAEGGLRAVTTGSTVMAGLNCGTPSLLAWPYLRDGLDASVTVTDQEAVRAVADLDALGTAAGPCGAATLAAARAALAGDDPERRRALGVAAHSVVVLLSTEHAVSPENGLSAGNGISTEKAAATDRTETHP